MIKQLLKIGCIAMTILLVFGVACSKRRTSIKHQTVITCHSPGSAANAFRAAIKSRRPNDWAEQHTLRVVLRDDGNYWLAAFLEPEGQVGGGLIGRINKDSCNVYKIQRGQ